MAQKIKDFANKFALTGKEVIDMLAEMGFGEKKIGGSAEDEELSALVNRLSLQSTASIQDFLSGKFTVNKKKPAKKSGSDTEEKSYGEKAKPDTGKKSEKPEEKSSAKVKAESEETAPQKAEDKKPAEKQEEKKPVQKQEEKKTDPVPEKAIKEEPIKEQKEMPADKKAEMSKDPKKPEIKKIDKATFMERKDDFKKSFDNRDGGSSYNKNTNQQRPDRPQFKDRNQQPSQGFEKKFDKFQQKPIDTRDDTRSFPDRGQRKPFDKQNGGMFAGKDKEQKAPQYNPAPKVKIKTETNVIKTKTGATRIVDTRTSDIDLSKYDEKIDNYASAYDSFGASQSKQKLKKQNTKDFSSKKEKERNAMEKLKREVFEKAKKTQLSITIPEEITVGELAARLKVVSGEVVKKLMLMGVMASVNEVIDYDTAYLIADEFGAKASKEVVVTIEEKLFDEEEDSKENLVTRAPVVCVMGHVDHGKTSLLDAIRHTHVTTGEAGGITQHIGAYSVCINGQNITFLDTPGHEAFTAMRLRGAMATDIAIIVVAADDGIMPQTIEAINHAKAAGVDIIVAINKMDKPTANPDNIKQELTKYDLVPEEWGGDVICVPVSAQTGMGISDLLENILLVAEVKELKANPNRLAKGIVIEAKLDKGRGPVATILVQNGTLNSGDVIIAGTSVGRVRAMADHNGKSVKSAGPSTPVEIIGLDEVPLAGDEFNAVKDEKMARQLASQRKERAKEAEFKANAKVNLDDLFAQINSGAKEINIIIKADVGGSCEAVKSSLLKLSNAEVKVNVIHTAVGGITESDVMLASASNAIIIGFNVRPDKTAIDSAARQNVDIRTHRIIYEIIEEMESAMKGMLAPTYKEVINGHAQVRQTIHVPSVGTIAGSYVQDGKITRSSQIRIIRDGIVIAEDKISSLRRFKDDVKEVAAGYECGVGLEKFNDIRENDVLEAFEMQEVAR